MDIIDIILARSKSFTGETATLTRQAQAAMSDANNIVNRLEAIQTETEEANEKAIAAAKKKAEESKPKPAVAIADFEKIDMRAGKVISCERHPNADKLFILKVNLGESKPRQIVSGLAQSYTPGQMIGKNIIVIANLKPAVLRGVESCGMLLAGKDQNQICVAEVNGLKPGTKIS